MHAGFVMLAAVVHVAVQLPVELVIVDVTVIVYPPVEPAVTLTEEPEVALNVPLPVIPQAKVPPPSTTV